MLTPRQCEIVAATVPALRAHGHAITKVFYCDMLSAHPELLDYFNPANQRDGSQAASLAASVLANASHIADPTPLGGMVERIAHKHVSLQIRPEHYPIVGHYLLGAIKTVLGSAATVEIMDAWEAAYGRLASIMIGREAALMKAGASVPSGWQGFQPLRVVGKTQESEAMTSFVLQQPDGSVLPDFTPGQYVSVRVLVPGLQHWQVRQYSLSAAPNGRDYRITVKQESAPPGVTGAPPGLVSNHLHHAVHVGDLLATHMPLGEFVLRPGSQPVVLLSGGAGITATLSMLEFLSGPLGGTREVVFLHAAKHRRHHAFGSHVRALAQRRSGISVAIFYEEVGADDAIGLHHDGVGRFTPELLQQRLPVEPADIYVCGPPGFMAGMGAALDALAVPPSRRFSETFAPDTSFNVSGIEPAPGAVDAIAA